MFHTEALRLEEMLADHGVAVRVGEASMLSDVVRFPLQLGLGATARRLLGLSSDLAREAGYSRCRLRREGRTLFLELPREEGAGLRYGDLLAMTGRPPSGSVILGLMDSGSSALLRLTNPAVRHLLVTGDPGAGKSELLRVLALGMAAHHAPRHWRLALLESHSRSPLAPLRALPHCWAWSERPEPVIGWLVRLLTEMTEREQERRVWPRVLAVVDDADRAFAVSGGVGTAVLKALLERGPAVGIHLAIGCRYGCEPLRELLPLLPVQLLGEGADTPGRFTLHNGSTAAPMMAARLDDRETVTVLDRMREGRPRLVAASASERSVA